MFEKLKRALRPTPVETTEGDGLARWAVDRMLSHHRLSSGGVVAEGLLMDRPFQAGCAPSSRPYIVGVELMARAELGLQDDVNIIVMHRALKRALEKAASTAYDDAVTHVHTTDKPLPEEMVWLSMYRDAGWPGPSAGFWARYCVLTDDLESARDWLDLDAIESLSDSPAGLRPVTPFLIALTRGKAYMRLQMEAPDDGQVSHYTLDTMEQLSARALKLFGR
jgi:hypothetical protein